MVPTDIANLVDVMVRVCKYSVFHIPVCFCFSVNSEERLSSENMEEWRGIRIEIGSETVI